MFVRGATWAKTTVGKRGFGKRVVLNGGGCGRDGLRNGAVSVVVVSVGAGIKEKQSLRQRTFDGRQIADRVGRPSDGPVIVDGSSLESAPSRSPGELGRHRQST
jgi:hypothetical protein